MRQIWSAASTKRRSVLRQASRTVLATAILALVSCVRFAHGQGGYKGVSLEGGKPFPSFAWRDTPEPNINAIWLYRYMSQPETGVSKVRWDHLVVARKYIGPLTPVSQ